MNRVDPYLAARFDALRSGVVERGVLVGRDAETGILHRFVDGIGDRSGVLLVEGEPGIGKTAVWFDAVRRAEAQAMVVLTARPAQAEAHSPWSALDDLVSGVDDPTLAALPPPQRQALDVALLRAPATDASPEPRAVWVAFRSIVMALSGEKPVLVAVDDAQWLDSASARAIAFLARRLPPVNVGILVSSRSPEDGRAPLELEQIDEALERISLSALSEGAIYQLIRHHLDLALPRRALRRVHETSGGNPLFALELARALAISGTDAAPGQPLAIPDTLRELVAGRVASVSPAALETMTAVAATSRPTVGVLASAGLDRGLAEAEGAGLVEVRGRRIAFTHPLLAPAAYETASSELRRSVHARLAAAADVIDERARHLALAATGPDDTVAATLDAAVTEAIRRGAPDQAADLAALAVEVSPSAGPDHWRRELVLGEQLFRSGETDAATGHLEAALVNAPFDHEQARAAQLLAEIAYETGVRQEAVALAEKALALAATGDDAGLLADTHTTLSLVLYDDNVRSAEHARLAVVALERQPEPNPRLLAAALVAAAEADFMIGRGLDRAAYDRASALEELTVPPRVRGRALASMAVNLKYADQLDEARHGLLAVWKMAEDEGDESSLPYALSHLPQLELWAGDWDRAESYARQHLQLAERTGQDAQRKQAEFNLALIAAHRGELAEARRTGDALVAEGVEAGEPWSERTGNNLLGFVDFSVDAHVAAVHHFDRALELSTAVGLGEPGLRRFVPNHVECLLAVGERERAEALLVDYEAKGQALDRISALGGSARCRALLAAADGDHAAAMAALAESLTQFRRGGFPFEQARTLLVEGRLRRRAREKRGAKDALQSALDLFVELGARRWAEQARDELGRVGLRPPAPLDLTATEQRVAELVGGGMSTREVADAMFLSPKTVEANLTRIYRKLGIRSRAELGGWLSRGASAQNEG